MSFRLGATLSGHIGHVTCTAFAPAGGRIVTGAFDGTIRLWDPTTGTEVGQLVPSASGDHLRDFLSSAGGDAAIPIWVLVGSPGSVALSADDTLLVAVCADQTIRLWEPGSGTEIRRSPMAPFFATRSAAISPDASVVAVTGSGRDLAVRLRNPITGEDLGRLVGHRGRANAVAMNAAGTMLATAGDDDTVRLDDHDRRFLDPLAFSPDGRRLAVACRDRSVRLWELIG